MTASGHGGNIWRISRQTGLPAADLIDFSANINPLGPPPAVRNMVLCSQVLKHYPDPDYPDFRGAIAGLHSVEARSVAVGAGASELLYSVVRAADVRRALLVAPTFSEYAQAVKSGPGKRDILRVYLQDGEDFRFTDRVQRKLLRKLREGKPDCLFLCRPNSPTGGGVPLAAVDKLTEAAGRTGTCVIVDESFLPFLGCWPSNSAAGLLAEHCNLVVVVSLTKILAVPGLRIGYAVSSPRLIEALLRVQPPWPVSQPAARAARAGLGDRSFLRHSRKWIARRRRELYIRLRSVDGVRVFPSQAPFLLLGLRGALARHKPASGYIRGALSKRGVMVRDCSTYPGLDEQFIRVAVRRRRENILLAEALHQLA